MTKREQMEAAITAKKEASKVAEVATVATPKPVKKTGQAKPAKIKRSAKARDARSKSRGRLPLETHVSAVWTGQVWAGSMTCFGTDRVAVYRCSMQRDGQFRLMEELDIEFWEWYATAPDVVKEQMEFAHDPKPPEKT